MSDNLRNRIMIVVEQTLNTGSSADNNNVTISENDSMETIANWDSLNFMSVFLAINEAFDLDPDFDDAINYISISSLYDYIKK